MSDTMVWMLVAVGGELVLLLLVLLSVSWWRNRAARQRDIKAMQTLVQRIRKGKDDRQAALQAFLSGTAGLDGEALSSATSTLWRAEVEMLQKFVGVYRDHDAAAAAQFDTSLTEAVAPYHAFAGGAPSGDIMQVGEPVDDAELEALRKENKRLSDELKITMETMSRMLNEYSTMFSGTPPDDAVPIAGSHDEAAGNTIPTGEVSEQEEDISVVVESSEDDETSSLHPQSADEAAAIPDVAESPDAADDAIEDDSQVPSEIDGSLDSDASDDAGVAGEVAGDSADSVLTTESTSPPDNEMTAKGADVEGVSELLIAGETEIVKPDDGPEVAAAEVPEGDGDLVGEEGAAGNQQTAQAGDAVTQDDIDSLFDGDDVESLEDNAPDNSVSASQDEIDDLFDAAEPERMASESERR